MDGNQIKKSRRLAIIASGRAGHNHEDFSKQINKKYLTEKFNQALPSETFNFYSINRDSLNTKIKNDIVGCEIDINSFSQEVLKYKEESKSPKTFNQYSPVSDLPYSKRDLSFSIKDYSSRRVLEKYIMEFDDELLKEVFVFDYFFNEKKAEIKIGFRFIFQSKNTTITETQVNELIGVIINHTEKIKGVTIPGLN